MRRCPTDAEGQKSLNLSEAARLIKAKCGGVGPCSRVLQRHCHKGRLDYFRLPNARAFFTTEAWVEAYLASDLASPRSTPGTSPELDRRTARALAQRQLRHAATRKGGGG